MTVILNPNMVNLTHTVNLNEYGERTLAVLPPGSGTYFINSITIEVLDHKGHCSPTIEIHSGYTQFGACLSLYGSAPKVLDVNKILEGDLVINVICTAEMTARITVVGNFEEKRNDMATYYSPTPTPDDHSDQFSKIFAHLDEIRQPAENPEIMAEFSKLNTKLSGLEDSLKETNAELMVNFIATLEDNLKEIKTQPRTEKKMSETDLDNSLWKELPEDIREAAEKAGIGLEDLHEMAKEYVALKENSRLYRRLLNFVRDDNHQTQLPISLAKIEAEKEMKLAKIQADVEVAKAEALAETAIAQAEADKAVHVSKHLSSGLHSLISWSAAAVAISYVAYCVCGVFI